MTLRKRFVQEFFKSLSATGLVQENSVLGGVFVKMNKLIPNTK